MKLIFLSLLAITPPALAANKTWDADESDTVRYDLPTEPHHLDEPISEPDRQNNVQNTQSGLCTARDGQSGLCKPPTTCGLKDNKVDPCNPEPKCGTQVASGGQRMVCCPSAAETYPPPNERACGKPGTATRIIGGTEVAAHAYPWQVGLFVNHGQGRGSLICGGTIIHRRFILTAAHCIRDRGPQDFYVLVGAHNSKTDGRFVGVVKVMSHENYRQESRYNDITIMKLSRNVSYGSTVKPACLPTKEMDEPTYVGRRATVTGWGTEDKSGGRKDNNLKETQVPIKDNEVCTKAYCPPK
ncbi:Proclotting enzyme [Halotydeus destructor]|nr:Proclotting enzyme [Halotydeus destructor]